MNKVAFIEKQSKYAESNYLSAIRSNVRGLWSGTFDWIDFYSGMMGVIRSGFEYSWEAGFKEYGLSMSDMTTEERIRLDQEIQSDYSYLIDYADAIDRNSRKNGGKLAPLFYRADMWTNRFLAIKSIAMSYAARDGKLEWVMNPIKEHCFAAGTPVLTDLGWKDIEDIQAGDKVITMDGYKSVIKTERNPYFGNLYRVGDVICTSRHRFLTENGWVSANRLSDRLDTHVAFPYSNHRVSTSFKVRVSSFVSCLLFKLPIGKGFKPRMTMPIISISLNDNIPDLGINNKLRLDNGISFIFNPKSVKIRKERGFELGGFVALNLLVSLHKFLVMFGKLFRMVNPIVFNLRNSLFFEHRIVVPHVLTDFRVSDSIGSFFAPDNMKNSCPINNLFPRKSNRFRNLISPHVCVVLFEKFISLFSPNSSMAIGGSTIFTIFPLSSSNRTTYLANTFSFSDRNLFPFTRGIDIPVSYTTKARTRFTWIENFFERFTTKFTKKLSRGIRIFISSWHNKYLLLLHNVTKHITLYHDNSCVYNLEVEDVHHFVAGGMVVHNCASCLMYSGRVYRASTWKKYDIYPRMRSLLCRGLRCGCEFRPTAMPCTPGKPPQI